MQAFQVFTVIMCAVIMCFKVNFSVYTLKGERYKNPLKYFKHYAGYIISTLFLISEVLTMLLYEGNMVSIQLIDLTVTFILIAVIDIKTYIIPNETVISFAMSQLMLSFATDVNLIGIWSVVIAGGVLGLLVLLSVLSYEQIGMGDVKILAVVALIYGLSFVLYSFGISLLLMLICATPCLIMKKINLRTSIPFMPFYTVGVITYVTVNVL